jgi:hypothetical protein
MTWNFCPHCGHRIYQHGEDGCLHVETVYAVESGGMRQDPRRTPCDCKQPHPLLIASMK